MVPNLNTMITLLAFGTPLLILFFFLPAIIELKKPKDCGPRLISGTLPHVPLSARKINRLRTIEEDYESADLLLGRLAIITRFLPDLEA